MPLDPSINGRAVQWTDLKTNQRKIVSDNMRDAGLGLPRMAAEGVERLKATEAKGGASAKVAGIKARSLEEVQPHLKSQPVTLQRAANTRQGFYNRGIEDRAAANPDDPHQVIPTGAGWYFEHHKEIRKSAEGFGFPHEHAIAASGVMSPQNSPENERAAVHAIMDTLANHKVTVTPEVHEHLAKNGIDASEHLGKSVHFDQLPTGSVAHLSSGSIRDRVDTTADLHQVARGGTKTNIIRAEKVLMGHTDPREAVDPHSAPKVWSYVHNTLQAEPGSAAHVEFMGRVHQDAAVRRGLIEKEQGALDLYGHNDQKLPDDHLLSPKSHTVEDTWQNAATFGQPMKMANRASVFKAAGSMDTTYPVAGVKTRVNEETGKRDTAHPDARVSKAGLTHAFNNRATQKASEQQGRETGVTLPPVAMQEVGWVQMRKDAGKDPEWNQRATEKADPLGGHVRGQMALPGMGPDIPGGERKRESIPQAQPHEEHYGMTAGDQEKDLRKWAAIGANVQKSRYKRESAARNLSEGQFG